LAIAFLCFLILARGFRGNGFKNIFPAAFALLLPFLVGGGILAAYNAARFGNPLETGIRYQLTDWDYTRRLGEMTSIQNILPNFYNYFFRPAQLSQSFPYLFPLNGKTTWGELNAVAPSLYYGDRVVGLLFSSPIFLLAILSAGGILWDWIRRSRKRKVEGTEASFTPQSESDRMAAALFGATVLLFVPLLLYFYCSERFLMDATPLLSITAAIVMWKVYHLVENHPLERTFLFLMMLCLLVISAVVNTLLGFSGHDLHFRELNPALFEQLSRWIAF
jgi:hypothetical protein